MMLKEIYLFFILKVKHDLWVQCGIVHYSGQVYILVTPRVGAIWLSFWASGFREPNGSDNELDRFILLGDLIKLEYIGPMKF